jgi:uncharacterized protein
MTRDRVILMTEEFVKERISKYDSGHDWWHIERVRRLAKYINDTERLADPFTLDITVLLHDIMDSKFIKDSPENGYNNVESFMVSAGLDGIKDQVVEVIRNVSFSNKSPEGNLKDPLLLIMQDADRLDAIGAIGIARAFNYGGFRNNPIFYPDNEQHVPSTISHFYDKLLKLKDMMNTNTGRCMAEERHKFLEIFLEQFYKEWNGEFY